MLLVRDIVNTVNEEVVKLDSNIDNFTTITNDDNYHSSNSYEISRHLGKSDPLSGFSRSIKLALEEAIAPLFSFEEPKRKFCIEDFMAEFEGEYFELSPEDQDGDVVNFCISHKMVGISIYIQRSLCKNKVNGCSLHDIQTVELSENLSLLIYTTKDGSVVILVDYDPEENEVTITSNYLIFHDLQTGVVFL